MRRRFAAVMFLLSNTGPKSRRTHRLLLGGILAAATIVFASAGHAFRSLVPDGASITGGSGNDVDVYGVGAYWDRPCECAFLERFGFDTRIVGQIAYWHGRESSEGHGSLWDAGLTPMLRWTSAPGPLAVYAEIGIGVHFLSATRINEQRQFGSAFQFGEQGGAGLVFGPGGRYELGVYIQHISNAGIKEPNNGITYIAGVLRAAFH